MIEVPFNIMVTGKVSTGKSSFINSLVGAYISCVSLNRETFSPIQYHLSKSADYKNTNIITKNLFKIHEKNQTKRNNLTNINPMDQIFNRKIIDKLEESISNLESKYDDPLPSVFDFDIHLYDMPGLSDAEDKLNLFGKTIENWVSKMDLVLYIVDATKAFLDKHEFDEFKKIQSLVNKNILEFGNHIELAIIVNKYDDADDEELEEIYNQIEKKINFKNIFRFCSHKFFVNNLKHGLCVPKFMIRETKKIFKNSQILNHSLFDSLEYCKELDYIYLDKREFNLNEINNGDHDHLIKWITFLKSDFNNRREEAILRKVTSELNILLKNYNTTNLSPVGIILETIKNKKNQMVNYCININRFTDIINKFINATKNLYILSYIWFNFDNFIDKKILSSRILGLILNDLHNNNYKHNKLKEYILFPEIIQSFDHKILYLLGYSEFWDYSQCILKFHSNKFIRSNNSENIDFKKLFPQYKILFYFAELNAEDLYNSHILNLTSNIPAIYRFKIKKFIDKYCCSFNNNKDSMKYKLFSDELISEQKMVKLMEQYESIKNS